MPIQDMTEEQFAEFIGKAVLSAFSNHPCKYNLDPDEVNHVFGMVADIGDGDLDGGVEVIRRIHTWAKKRIAMDDELMANHRFTTKLRTVGDGVLTKLIAFTLWGGVALAMFALACIAVLKAVPLLAPIFKAG